MSADQTVYEDIRKTLTEPCCDIWPKIADRLDWMRYADYPEIRTMPHLRNPNDLVRYRVNFCPSCGKDRRGVTEEVYE